MKRKKKLNQISVVPCNQNNLQIKDVPLNCRGNQTIKTILDYILASKTQKVRTRVEGVPKSKGVDNVLWR